MKSFISDPFNFEGFSGYNRSYEPSKFCEEYRDPEDY